MPAFSQSFLTASLVQGGSDAAEDAEIWHVARSALLAQGAGVSIHARRTPIPVGKSRLAHFSPFLRIFVAFLNATSIPRRFRA